MRVYCTSQDSTPGYLPGENLPTHAEEGMVKEGHDGNVYNSKNLYTTQMPINEGMDKL